jgi:amidophosphoribosyltransferase
VKWPCFYGIDFATRAELIANGLSVDEICTSIGADSLAYISLDQLIESTNVAKDDLCRACFDGVYPVELPEPQFLGKHMLEGMERTVAAEHVSGVTAGGGANDALLHP